MTPCKVEARYWRKGVRWQIVLQVTYLTSATEQAAGTGPYFVIGYAWLEQIAAAKTREANERLARSRTDVLAWEAVTPLHPVA